MNERSRTGGGRGKKNGGREINHARRANFQERRDREPLGVALTMALFPRPPPVPLFYGVVKTWQLLFVAVEHRPEYCRTAAEQFIHVGQGRRQGNAVHAASEPLVGQV